MLLPVEGEKAADSLRFVAVPVNQMTLPALGASPLASQALLPTGMRESAKSFDQAPIRYETRETEKKQGLTMRLGIIAGTLADLTRDVHADMKEHGYKARTITIKIRFSDFETFTRAMTIPDYTDSEEEIRKTAFACLKRIELKKNVRLVGVRVSNFQGKNKDDQHHPEVLDRLI